MTENKMGRISFLKQVLLLEQDATFGKAKRLIELARIYQKENEELILQANPREKIKILNKKQ